MLRRPDGHRPVATRLSTMPPLAPAAWLRRPRPSQALPFPLGDPFCRLFDRGRHALLAGLRCAALEPGDEVLVPAWHHGSEVEALLTAGLVPRFYDRVVPDPAELEALMGPRVRALHLTHALGYPQDAGRWRAWCDERGLVLIEDAAQAWMARVGDRPAGAWGDIAIFCFYKTLGVPDGGGLITRRPPPGPVAGGARGLRMAARLQAVTLAQRHGAVARMTPGDGDGPYDAARDMAVAPVLRAPSRTTLWLLPRLAAGAEGAARARRAHARALCAALDGLVPEPFAVVPDGAAPLSVPIRAEDPDRVLAALRARGVDAMHFWSVPHPALPAGGHPVATSLRATTVELPVHQGLGPADVARIAAAVEASA